MFRKRLITVLAVAAMLALPAMAMAEPGDASTSNAQLARKVRHELLMLPYYGVFDNLEFKINGSTVTLYGQVVRPTTSSDAAARVGRIAGVSQVVNRIEVLPLSPFDDSIRRRAYGAIFGRAGLGRYAMGTNPSIHIVVNRGHITLEGVVANDGDRTRAYIAAQGVSGAFSVTNHLRLESEIPS